MSDTTSGDEDTNEIVEESEQNGENFEETESESETVVNMAQSQTIDLNGLSKFETRGDQSRLHQMWERWMRGFILQEILQTRYQD